MTKVQIEISDADRERFVRQARREGMTLSGGCTPLPANGLKIVSRPSPSLPWEDAMAFFPRLRRFGRP